MTVSSLPKADLFEVLSRYIDMGWPVLPIWGLRSDGVTCACPDGPKYDLTKHPHGKHPCSRLVPNGVKGATLDKAILRQWVAGHSKGNWGVRCGLPMLDGRHLVVLDRDPRNGGNETLELIQGHRGELPETVTQESGGGGGHYIFGSVAAVGACKAGPGLDVLGAEKYFLVSPSGHASGGVYAWALGLGLGEVEIADAPAWLLEGAQGPGARPARVGEDTARDTILGEAFALAGRLGPVFPDGCAAVCCPWAAEHSDQRGLGQDSSTVILPPAGGSRFGGFSCKHSHCATRTWQDVLKALPPSAVAAAQQKYPMLRPVAEAPAVIEKGQVDTKKKDELQDVRERLSYKPCKSGFKIVSDIVNLITILSYDPRWKGILRFDEFSQVLRITRDPPWHADDKPKDQGDTWSDEDTTRLDAWLRRYWSLELKTQAIREAVYIVGKRDALNPLVTWLDSLVWDGTKRLDTWLMRYLGTLDTPYLRSVGAKWMISAVARAYKPGCKADHLMILEGPQGKGKSTALRALAGEAFFSDSPIEIGSKDSFQALRGKWIIELQELASLNRSEADRIKAFFSSPTDRYRPSYGREMVEIPRSTIFCGSVNHGQYLNDSTGGRRFWPVSVGVIDLEGIKYDREQLWAEARDRFRAGESWWPSYEEIPLFEKEQEAREVGDAWDGTIIGWLHSEKAHTLARVGGVTVTQVAENALGIEISALGIGEQRRIGNVLVKAGCERLRVRDGGRHWVYKLPKAPGA